MTHARFKVAAASHELGLGYTILKVKWPEDVDPQRASNFETLARRLRYRALGEACRKNNVQSLLVAHHKDDQAETVFMRIAQGHRGTGLRCILPVSDIPECWAIHGVSQSGAREATDRTKEHLKMRHVTQDQSVKSSGPAREGEGSSSLEVEDGGIKIYRPLLDFEKERLKATCMTREVRWFEDKTNQDPALTPRNAVRQLLQHARLPDALQRPSLSALATRMQQRHEIQTRRVKRMVGSCDISMLDTRIGALIVRFICKPVDRSVIPVIYMREVLREKEYLATLMLRRVMEMVSPAPSIPLERLYLAAKAIFLERFDFEPPDISTGKKHPSQFTCGGIFFERVYSPRQASSKSSLDPDFVWILSRQPYSSSINSPSLRITSSSNDLDRSNNNHSGAASSSFSLWDGRFWFRVHNPHPTKSFVIRPLHPADLALLRSTQPKSRIKELDELLHIVAPRKIRWTIPVIAKAEEEVEEEDVVGNTTTPSTHPTPTPTTPQPPQNNHYPPITPPSTPPKRGGQVLALPTLNLDFGARARGIVYEVRFKRIGDELERKGFEEAVI